jgi:hypothetical protein
MHDSPRQATNVDVKGAKMKENPEKYSLLGCNTVYFGEIPKFRRNI